MLEEEKKEEEGRQEGVGVEGQEGSTSGLVKKTPEKRSRCKRNVLSALRDAIRNGEMFSEENLFTEMVSGVDSARKVEDVRTLSIFGLADNQWFAHQMWAPCAYQ